MAKREVLTIPDARLRATARPVGAFDADLDALIDDLVETMQAAGAIGLSAPQLGDARRVAVLDVAQDGSDPLVFVNPEILAKGTAVGLVEESCLSLPGISGNVVRAVEVTVRAQDRDGRPFERALRDMEAICLQHEIDHLDGTLFVDRLSFLKRLALRLGGHPLGRAAA